MIKSLGLIVFSILVFAGNDKLLPSIVSAREQVLKKDRAAALKILNEAEKTEKSIKKRNEIRSEARRIAQIFFTNEGQRAYELAETIRYSGQAGYLVKYEEALAKEGSHLGIHLGIASGHLAAKNCTKAAEAATAATDLISDNIEAQFLLWRSQLCLNPHEAPAIRLPQDLPAPALAVREALLALAALQRQEFNGAENFARKAIVADANYPMGYYWLWQVKLKEGATTVTEEAEKYLALCKEVTPESRRKYYLDSDLCFDLVAAQEYLKKAESRQ
jgi:hypothetical protein